MKIFGHCLGYLDHYYSFNLHGQWSSFSSFFYVVPSLGRRVKIMKICHFTMKFIFWRSSNSQIFSTKVLKVCFYLNYNWYMKLSSKARVQIRMWQYMVGPLHHQRRKLIFKATKKLKLKLIFSFHIQETSLYQ